MSDVALPEASSTSVSRTFQPIMRSQVRPLLPPSQARATAPFVPCPSLWLVSVGRCPRGGGVRVRVTLEFRVGPQWVRPLSSERAATPPPPNGLWRCRLRRRVTQTDGTDACVAAREQWTTSTSLLTPCADVRDHASSRHSRRSSRGSFCRMFIVRPYRPCHCALSDDFYSLHQRCRCHQWLASVQSSRLR